MKIKSIGSNQTEVITNIGVAILVSYETPVAAVDLNNGTGTALVTETNYSPTTTRHINNWLATKSFSSKETRPQKFFDNLI
jgi:hypothetical protein